MAQAADERHDVLLELHARAAPVAEAAAGKGVGDVLARDLDTGRKALDDAHEGRAVRLTCGQPTKHAGHHFTASEAACIMSAMGAGVAVKSSNCAAA